jgi:hypothetical protein
VGHSRLKSVAAIHAVSRIGLTKTSCIGNCSRLTRTLNRSLPAAWMSIALPRPLRALAGSALASRIGTARWMGTIQHCLHEQPIGPTRPTQPSRPRRSTGGGEC